MTLRNKFALLLPAAMLAACSCSYNPNSYSCFSDIDPLEGWSYGRTFVYLPQISDSIACGRLELLVRHTNDYPYSNLWVELESQQPVTGGHIELRCDTFCITLADVYGNWQGRGQGTTFEKIDTLYIDHKLINGAPIRLRHVMRPERVEGLEKVGLIFNPTKNEQ